MKIKVDLHIHSNYSKDSNSTFDEICSVCQKKGIQKVAITDHDEIKGALEFAQKDPERFIVGEEILTNKGEIIGLFLKKHVPSHMSPEKTIEEIKKQEGVVYIPHAFDPFRHGLEKYIYNVLNDVDVIEVFNSRSIFNKTNQKALKFAKKHNLLEGGGSDAHQASQIGNAYVELEHFFNADQFLKSLKEGRVVGIKTSPFRIFISWKQRIKNYLFPQKLHLK